MRAAATTPSSAEPASALVARFPADGSLPEVAIGAMVAALFAGLVSLLGLIISKEQKISEFRQAWINSLQTDIASLISHANAIHSGEHAGYTSGSEAWKVVRPDFLGINQAAANIRLSLNPNECESLAVLRQIKNVEDLLAPGKAVDYRRLDEIEHELVRKAQILLKKEWIRVKRGERVYSPFYRRVGFRITRFEACSAFTKVAARMLAEPPMAALLIGVLQTSSLPPSPAPTATGWSDSCRAGFAPAEGRRLRTAHGKVGLGARMNLLFVVFWRCPRVAGWVTHFGSLRRVFWGGAEGNSAKREGWNAQWANRSVEAVVWRAVGYEEHGGSAFGRVEEVSDRFVGPSRVVPMGLLDETFRAKFQSWYPGLFHVRNADCTEHALAA